MAKRTIRPAAAQPEDGQPDRTAINERHSTHGLIQPIEGMEGLFKCAICGAAESELGDFTCGEYAAKSQPPSNGQAAENFLESPPIPATLADPEVTAETAELPVSPEPTNESRTIGEIIGVDGADDPGLTELRARNEWRRKLDDAKNDHLQASLQVEHAKNELKAAKERQKDALDFYIGLEARGPVIPEPVTLPADQSSTQQPLPPADSSENAWRSIPLADLPLDTIKGLGDKKRDALLECCPTLGAFTDKQVEAGASGVDTVLPKGIGKAITDPLEEMLLDYLVQWRANAGAEDAAKAGAVSTTDCSESSSAPAATPAESSIPSFTEWELMTDEQRQFYLVYRTEKLRESAGSPHDLTAAYQSGQIACGRGDRSLDCPYIPGDEMDGWLRGFIDAERDSADVPQGELEPAGVAEGGASLSLFDDLDGI